MLIILFRTSSKNFSYSTVILVTLGVLLFTPFLEQLTIGQVNSLILLGIALYILGRLDSRYQLSGDIGLGAAISIKLTPAILLAFPLFYRDWKSLLHIFLTLIFLTLSSIIFFGFSPWINFIDILPALFQGFSATINQAIAPSINWLVNYLFHRDATQWIGPIFSSLVLGIWLATSYFPQDKVAPAAMLSFGVITMTISPSVIWFHHLVFLIVPILFFLLNTNTKTRSGQLKFLLVVGAAFLINASRMAEFRLTVLPIFSILGYLILYISAALAIYFPSSIQNDSSSPTGT